MIQTSLSVHFDPLLPTVFITFAIGLVVAFIALSILSARRAIILRALACTIFILALLGPSLLEEEREPVKDIAVIVVDESQSQSFDKRAQRSEDALKALEQKLSRRDDLELRIIKAPLDKSDLSETRLFESLEQSLADVPLKRRAGVIVISDGQVHDAPQNIKAIQDYGPVHLLLTGEKNEKDRQLVILEAPSYGIVGQNVSVKYRIEDTSNIREDYTTLTITKPGAPHELLTVPVNKDLEITIPITHPGQNIFELSSEALPDEITAVNNRAALNINGVRDRLRVLLVSGKPHPGGRSWRDLLTSDPSVDLVHFTILRDPSKLDSTPQKELSLIAFPFRELFEIKLHEFDLVIFDRYQLSRILPDIYFDNIARYVKKGGALLEASGPAFATEDSLYFTSLMSILPGRPTGGAITESYKPQITERGKFHPVTHALGAQDHWGSWLRQVIIEAEAGETLMNGVDNNPLLVLSRMQEGRVAQIASDHIWLWARGYEGGGPHAELLRRVVHWLMKEPELDERALRIHVSGQRISIKQWHTDTTTSDIKITKPDGEETVLTLKSGQKGLLSDSLKADQLGVYSFEDAAGQKSFAIVGDLNPPELRGVKTTPEPMQPAIKKSGGKAVWLAHDPFPSVRLQRFSKNYAGHNWIGLRQNNDYTVQSVRSAPLLPVWLSSLIIILILLSAWWREGRG